MKTYNTQYMTQDEIERMQITEELMKIYPYTESWYLKKSLAQLIAMYHKPVPAKKKKPVITKPERKATYRINEETGDKEILTDGGHWEPFDD